MLRVDHFGNLITNLKPEDAPTLFVPDTKFAIKVGTRRSSEWSRLSPMLPPTNPSAMLGSSGYLEISVNKGNAARTLAATRGSEVNIEVG